MSELLNNKIHIKKREAVLERVPLVDESQNLVKKAKVIFIKWFKEYSTNDLMDKG